MSCTAYMCDEKIGPDTSPTACTWFVEPIYVMKKVGPETSPTACTAYIYIC
jgi:hypothetical protein